jgi:CRISPR-associated Csx2 family protein
MARKVFISFLGNSFYGECQYSSGNFTSSKTRFVQQATLEWIKYKEGAYPDVAKILLTNGENGSRITNWDIKNGERCNPQTKKTEPYSGLKKVLEGLKINASAVDIVDGKNEIEIWQIFEVIFSHLQEKDRLYFDLTHGFRYLPMLLLVLGNYAKFLKNTTVNHISYGNYETRNVDIAPFVDLLPLSQLQNWSTAAKDFIDYGKTRDLKNLLEEKSKPKLKETKGKDESAKTIRDIANKLQNFSHTILANKLDKIIEGISLHEEIEILRNENVNEVIPKPSIPIMEKINDKLTPFQNDELENVFAATNWCIKHELYQNAYSILLEGIISIVLNLVKEEYLGRTSLIEAKRGLLNYVAGYRTKNKNSKESCIEGLQIDKKLQNDSELLKSIVGKIWDLMDDDFAELVTKLNSMRNSYMHGGTGTNSLGKFADLKQEIEKCNKKLADWYQQKNKV